MSKNTTTIRRRTGGGAFEQGIVFGIILGVIQVIFYLLNKSITGAELILPISIIGLVIAFLMYLFSGIQAAHHTGRVGSGAFAGIWTGIIAALISLIISFLLGFNNPVTMLQQIQTSLAATANTVQINQTPMATSNQYLFNFIIATGLINLICTITLGLVIGTIGGIIGAPRYRQTYRDSAFQTAASAPEQKSI